MTTIINMAGEKIVLKANKKSITVDYRNQKVQIPFGVDRFKYLLEKFEPNEYDVIGVKVREVAHLNDLDEKEAEIINRIKQMLPPDVSVCISSQRNGGVKITFFYKCGEGVIVRSVLADPVLREEDILEIINLIKNDLV